MAILRMELDIDSEVHPELYARLASLERLPAREEKLRQLAATGLIWEIDRLHGPAFTEADAATAGPPAPAPESPPFARPPEAVEAGALADHVERVPVDVPVLLDVVDEAEAAGAQPIAASAIGLADLPPPPPPPPAPAKTRSARMKRMKEAGLFQDG